MSVKSTVDLSVEQARAFFRAMVPADPIVEDELFAYIGNDRSWHPDPGITREFFEMIRGEEEITDIEGCHRRVEHVIEAAFDMLNDGEGFRNFFIVFGDGRGRLEPLDMGDCVDRVIHALIEVGLEGRSTHPGM